MRTIRENLEEAVGLLSTNLVQNHLKAAYLVSMDLSHIQGFDPDPITVLALYHEYLISRHQMISKVGIWNKIKGYFHSVTVKTKMLSIMNRCDTKTFGDGDKYIKEINLLIRKAI